MARNVEIKARVRNPGEVAARAETIADGPPELLVQHDTFYNVPSGRLKLRVFPSGEGELISYRRTDATGPKTSEYHLVRTDAPDALHEVLAHALGVRRVVSKQRTLLHFGRTRIHLDEVEDLGHFMELEVVLQDGEDERRGVEVAHDLLARLGVSYEDLVAGAYVDLLDETCGAEG
jgi:predicted adenylyl cyclase CyaB